MKTLMTKSFLLALTLSGLQARANDDEPVAIQAIRCEFTENDKTSAIEINVAANAVSSVTATTDGGLQLRFSTIKKYGSYDLYPNVVLTVSKGDRTLFSSTMVGNRDEYGAFTIGLEGSSDYVYGRCDAI